MKQSALLALLPILASLSPISVPGVVAHPHHHGHGDKSAGRLGTSHRKTLGFGITHPHADYKVLSTVERELLASQLNVAPSSNAAEDNADVGGGHSAQLDSLARQVAVEFVKIHLPHALSSSAGDSFYVRDDSYTDHRTLTSHVYIRQIVNGLEVTDGDINVNVDRHGKVLSWGSSFYPGPAPPAGPVGSAAAGRSQHCQDALSLLKLKDDAPAIADVGQTVLDGVKVGLEAVGSAIFGEAGARFIASHLHSEEQQEVADHSAHHRKHLLDNLRAVCSRPNVAELQSAPSSLAGTPAGEQDAAFNEAGMLSARQALAGVLSDLLPSHNVVPDDAELLDTFRSHHAPTLASPYAYAEPPVEIISNVPFVVGADAADSNDDGQVKARLVYHQVRDDHVPEGVSLKLCWKFDVPLEDNWYDVHVDSVSGEIVAAIDYVSDAPPGRSRDAKALKGGKQKPLPGPGKSTPAYTYSVFPFGINDPVSGNISSVTEPWDKVASPAGWHAFPDKANLWLGRDIKGVTSGNKVNNSTVKWTNATTTIGNNVFAQEDWAGQSQWLTNSRPENSSMIFDYEYGEPEGLRPQEYVDFAVTQLFYTSNMYHDLLYRLGFDEVSGNFQMENWGKGGRGGDAVLAYAQAGEGTNNANFATPPDGTQPRMRMYLWSTATPYRDGDLEAGIVIHEYSHGLSTRLTGGPMNSGCLGYGEAGGMGEGWGDAMATFIRQIEEYSTHGVYSMGAWAANTEKGIRNYKYSSNSTINPSTYKTLDKPGYWGVHAIGEVWAEFLFVLEELLISKHGFSKTLFPPEDPSKSNDYYRDLAGLDAQGKPKPLVPKHGNTLTVQLVVDAMKLQPCRPSFANARDAIIAADVALTGGENTCDIWTAFAGRGLGVDAKIKGQLPWGGGIREEDYTMPKSCKKHKGKH